MTATRIGRTTLVVCLGGAWLVAAWLLTRTSVPDLHLGGTDGHRWFSERQIDRAERFERFDYVLWPLHFVATVVALVILSRRAPRLAASIALGRVGTGVIVGMVMLVTLWAVSLPFGLADQWWEARHGLAPHDYVAWLLAPWPELTVETVFALSTIAIVMGLAGRLGGRWWLAGAPVFAVLAAAFAFAFGYVASVGTNAVKDPRLRTAVTTLERREGVEGTPVRVEEVSDFTKQANAYASGFGPSTHVVLWDTLLDGRFSHGAVRFVLAHELGHVAHRHVLKGLAWFALLALPLAWFVTWATRRRGGLANPASLPLALLALTLATFAAAPIENAVSRRYEAEADWSALKATNDPGAGRELFRGFQHTSLQDPSPPRWAYLWFQTHPTLAQRLAMVEAWRRGER
jgi:Zn-dependent protease with chaperone function